MIEGVVKQVMGPCGGRGISCKSNAADLSSFKC